MKRVFVASDNIFTPLGFTTQANLRSIIAGETGIKLHEDIDLSPEPFWASVIETDRLNEAFTSMGNVHDFTRLEKMLICSVADALTGLNIDIAGERTLMILSTTKGSIDLLDTRYRNGFDAKRVYLWETARVLQRYFGMFNKPLVVSNACISGLLAIIIASRLIRNGSYDHIIVTGADLVTEFVLSGFKSFQSLCQGVCKPFDINRQGLSLGEAAGTVILSATEEEIVNESLVFAGAGFSSNDANHISGPSRTGEGLLIAITRTLQNSGLSVDHVSAHGTATPYNDEMEAIALNRAGLNNVPVNSMKGYWGHTLGAAGIIESVACIHSLKNNLLIKTMGFETIGVTQPIAVINNTCKSMLQSCLKIASGFGGCNASLLFHK